jgi:hypothetical protein
MVNGKIQNDIFRALDTVRKRFQISDKDWADASGIGAPTRITELRKAYEKRPFTYEKARKLRYGLSKLKGDLLVRKELSTLIDTATTERDKVILLALCIPDNQLKTCKMYLEALIKTEKEG